MATKDFGIFILIATILAHQASWVRATDYIVGDDPLGWGKPGVDYKAWACGKQFVTGDKLWFGYIAGTHNVVLLPDQCALDSCCFANKIAETASCGYNSVTLGEGTYYITSQIGEDCKNGMKFKIDVKPRPGMLEGIDFIVKK